MSAALPGIPRHDRCDHPVQTFEGAMLPCATCSAPAPVLRWPARQPSALTFNGPLSPAMRTESVELYRMAASGVAWWARRHGDAMPLEVAAQLQFRRVERAYVDALAVLHDLGAERGASWLAEAVAADGARWVPLVTQHRAALLRWLTWWYAERCPACDVDVTTSHARDCAVAALLRALGGDEETQRQVEAAWEEALRMASRATSTRYQVDTTPAMRVGDVTYQTSPFLGPSQAFAIEPEELVCGRCGGTGEDPEYLEPCGECQTSE